jgi:hypothetical protein
MPLPVITSAPGTRLDCICCSSRLRRCCGRIIRKYIPKMKTTMSSSGRKLPPLEPDAAMGTALTFPRGPRTPVRA